MPKKEKKKWKYLILLLLFVFAISIMVIYKDKLAELGAVAPSGGASGGNPNNPNNPTNQNCVDTDGGRNYDVTGVCSDSNTLATPDTCSASNAVNEGYCENNGCQWETYMCPPPKVCVDGRCETPNQNPAHQYYCCETNPIYTESKISAIVTPPTGSYTCQQDACPQYTYQVSGPFNDYATCVDNCIPRVDCYLITSPKNQMDCNAGTCYTGTCTYIPATLYAPAKCGCNGVSCADVEYPTSQADCNLGVCSNNGDTCTYEGPMLYSSKSSLLVYVYGSCVCSGGSCNVGTADCYSVCKNEFGSYNAICYSGRCPLGYAGAPVETTCSQQANCDNCCCQLSVI